MKRFAAPLWALCAAGCLGTAWSAESSYRVEKLPLKAGPSRIEAISRRTLVHDGEPGRYSIKNLFDNNKATPWVTRYDKKTAYSDEGLFKVVFETPVYVKSLTVRNGCQRTENLFHANQRVKTLSIEKVLVGGRSFPLENSVTLKDSLDPQEISLRQGWTPTVNLFRTKELIFNVAEVYEGTKYQDLCISDITVNYANGIEHVPSVSWKELGELIDKNAKKNGSGWDWGNLTRNDHRLFNDLVYYALAGNKDAYSRFSTYVPAGTADSAGMSNIYRNAVKESLPPGAR